MKRPQLIVLVATAWAIITVTYLISQRETPKHSCSPKESNFLVSQASVIPPSITTPIYKCNNNTVNHIPATASFCQHFDFVGLTSWLVVVPDGDFDLYQNNLPKCRLRKALIPFKVVKESLLIGRFGKAGKQQRKVRGYLKQMLLKLAVATQAEGFYLVLDSDVYAYTAFTVSDLFMGGKAKLDLEHPIYSAPERWFKSSAEVLGLDLLRANTRSLCASASSDDWSLLVTETRGTRDNMRVLNRQSPFTLLNVPTQCSKASSAPLHSNARVFAACVGSRDLNIGFTPMILHSAPITKYLIPRLQDIYGISDTNVGDSWVQPLLNWHFRNFVDIWYLQLSRVIGFSDKSVSWTEYSLYFWAVVDSGLFDQIYSVVQEVGSEQGGSSKKIVETGDYYAADWAKMFTPLQDKQEAKIGSTKRPFLLIHSWMRIPIDEVNAKIAPHMPELRALLAED
ncbi:hypothetical protein BDR26DRAFT_855427 [Obelidium mucronatum]|nr:hypothetical protein BDR26DRAFT_855427 [Obelidium mucronatum]